MISRRSRGRTLGSASRNTGPWYAPSANSLANRGNRSPSVDSNKTPPSRSWMLAAWTIACLPSPKVSTNRWRFLPLLRLPASNPGGSIRRPLFRHPSHSDCRWYRRSDCSPGPGAPDTSHLGWYESVAMSHRLAITRSNRRPCCAAGTLSGARATDSRYSTRTEVRWTLHGYSPSACVRPAGQVEWAGRSRPTHHQWHRWAISTERACSGRGSVLSTSVTLRRAS